MAQTTFFDETTENSDFLSQQIITYLGNKRALLGFIGNAVNIVRNRLNKDKLDVVDMFSGSGIVSRYFKQFANKLFSNDLENYVYTINNCYLKNKSEVDFEGLEYWYNHIINKINVDGLSKGFIAEMYAPQDDINIKLGERVFYTSRNAMYIDTARQLIAQMPTELQPLLLAPLLTEASVNNNTSGVFKGFYKNAATGIGQYGGTGENALTRIKRDIVLKKPIFSNFECSTCICQTDANKWVDNMPAVDLVYIDPPYNQHPYGSNYFMLNLINDYEKPTKISKVSGIPIDWNHSAYNIASKSYNALEHLCKMANSKYLLISFSSEGFIKKDDMLRLLNSIGKVEVMETQYNTFRGSRNLRERELHIREYLYLVEKA